MERTANLRQLELTCTILYIEHVGVILQALYIDCGILKSLYMLCIHATHTVLVSCRPEVDKDGLCAGL